MLIILSKQASKQASKAEPRPIGSVSIAQIEHWFCCVKTNLNEPRGLNEQISRFFLFGKWSVAST
jgi:hypothetical protein